MTAAPAGPAPASEGDPPALLGPRPRGRDRRGGRRPLGNRDVFDRRARSLGRRFSGRPGSRWPLMAAVQMACARIGMVTGRGLAGALRQKFPRGLVAAAAVALLLANTLNVGADLAGMADAAEMLTGWDSHLFVVAFGVGIAWAIIRFRYHQIASVLKWLALVLFAYVVAAFDTRPDWGQVLRAAVAPGWPTQRRLGDRSSRSSERRSRPTSSSGRPRRRSRRRRRWAGGFSCSAARARRARPGRPARSTSAIGTFFSNLVMFFVILTTALTLHRHGLTQLETSREVAQALRPLAGPLRRSRCTPSASWASACWRFRRSPDRRPMRSPRPSAGGRASTRS